MRNNINVPYGYNYFTIGRITVYTAKIRVKCDNTAFHFMFNSAVNNHYVDIHQHKNDCIAITWTTTDFVVHNMYRELVNNKLASIMHERVTNKYSYSDTPVACEL